MSRPTVFVYPGQGSQRLGMGVRWAEEHAAAREIYAEASDAIDLDLLELCSEGPIDRLEKTEFAQPAVVCASAAVHATLIVDGFAPTGVAGHSVGEFTALWAAGCMSLTVVMQLVRARGLLMGHIRRPGAMVGIDGLSVTEVESLCASVSVSGPISIGLHNGPCSHVVSGDRQAVAECRELALMRGARRARLLRTSNAFHSPLMNEVADEWEDVVDNVELTAPRVPIALNATGRLSQDLGEIRSAMRDQLTLPVKWHECLSGLASDRAIRIIECADPPSLGMLCRASQPRALVASARDATKVMAAVRTGATCA